MRVQVRKCPFTGKLFEERNIKKYAVHLSNIRDENRHKWRLKHARSSFKGWLAAEKEKITSIDMIAPWLLKNQEYLMDVCNSGIIVHHCVGFRDKFVKGDKFTNIQISRSYYSANTSNSHSCPENGVQNWHQESDKPTGYKGWSINISGTLARAPKDMSSYPYGCLLNIVGIATGTGGGGNSNWRYDGKIFLNDWPGLQHTVDEMEKDKIVKRLSGERYDYS